MATELQRRAVERIVENGGNVSRSMMEVGYSPATAKTPQKLTESEGYKELLSEYGLTEGLVARALVADIEAKPKRRIEELKLAAEIIGMKKVQGTGEQRTLVLQITGETAQRYALTSDTEASSA